MLAEMGGAKRPQGDYYAGKVHVCPGECPTPIHSE